MPGCLSQRTIFPTLRSLCACLLALWCVATAGPVLASESFSLTGFGQREDLAARALLWIDQDHSATLDTLPAADSPEWRHNSDGKVNFGTSPAAFWLRIALTDLNSLQEVTYVRLNYPHLDAVDFHVLAAGKPIHHIATGDTRPFNARAVTHRTFLLPLTAQMPDQVDIVVRVKTQGPVQLPVDLITRSALDAEEKPLYLWFGFYFGIMAIMLLYNGIIFLFVRDISYLLYLAYIVATAALQFTLYGFSFQYLWPESTTLNNLMV